jgi:hypothetical protein
MPAYDGLFAMRQPHATALAAEATAAIMYPLEAEHVVSGCCGLWGAYGARGM